MSLKRRCYCSKCDGLLVSERTERAHRNGPAFRQLEAASRQPGRQKRQKLDETPELELSSDSPQFSDTNINVGDSDNVEDPQCVAIRNVSSSILQLTG